MATRALLTIASLVLAPLAGADLCSQPTARSAAFRSRSGYCEPLVRASTPSCSAIGRLAARATVTGARSFGSYVDPAADFTPGFVTMQRRART
jgi:hypothetical protein